jgi:uncharacterized coiled-coil protein SlyX
MPDSTPDDRLLKLEESQAFSDHKVDQLAQQILALNQRLTEVLKRLGAIETRLVHADEVRKRQDSIEPGEPD